MTNDPAQERIDAHLDDVAVAMLEERIRAGIAHLPDFELIRVAQVRGDLCAVFNYSPHPTYAKTFATGWYRSESELLEAVLDTFETFHYDDNGDDDMNIFSAEMFEYLSAEMFPPGRTLSLTIKDVVQEAIAGPRGEANKVTVSFVERPKKLILNKTNARAIAHALGPETDDWRGAAVVMGVENVKVGRNTVPSIRVKSATARNGQRPQQPTAQAQPAANGESAAQLFDMEPAPAAMGAYQE